MQVLPVPAGPSTISWGLVRSASRYSACVGLSALIGGSARSISNLEPCSSMISAVPDERALRRRFLLTCLLKDGLLLLVRNHAPNGPAPRRRVGAPWSQDFGLAELLRKETTRAATTDDPLTPGCVHLLIDSPSTDPRIR